VRFRQVESFALTSLHELGIAEPTARAAAKRLDIAWAAIPENLPTARLQRPVAAPPGGPERSLTAARDSFHVALPAVGADRANNDRMRADTGGISIPIHTPEVVGSLRRAESMIVRPPGDRRSATPASSGRPGMSTASNRWAGKTVLP